MIRGKGIERQFFYLNRSNLMRYITLVLKAMSRYAYKRLLILAISPFFVAVI